VIAGRSNVKIFMIDKKGKSFKVITGEKDSNKQEKHHDKI